MGESITALLEEAGTLFVSVPFAWHIHAYPSDYWRFTPGRREGSLSCREVRRDA